MRRAILRAVQSASVYGTDPGCRPPVATTDALRPQGARSVSVTNPLSRFALSARSAAFASARVA